MFETESNFRQQLRRYMLQDGVSATLLTVVEELNDLVAFLEDSNDADEAERYANVATKITEIATYTARELKEQTL